jgi:hypothetical protein
MFFIVRIIYNIIEKECDAWGRLDGAWTGVNFTDSEAAKKRGTEQVTPLNGQGLQAYGTLIQNGTQNDFLGTRHSLLAQFFLNFFARPESLYF